MLRFGEEEMLLCRRHSTKTQAELPNTSRSNGQLCCGSSSEEIGVLSYLPSLLVPSRIDWIDFLQSQLGTGITRKTRGYVPHQISCRKGDLNLEHHRDTA